MTPTGSEPNSANQAAEQNRPPDDLVLPFRTVNSRASGRIIRLGPAVDEILKGHEYPEPVSVILGQAVALTAMLGSALKFDGRLILQTKTDGAIDMLVVNFDTPGAMRGYASFDGERLSTLDLKPGTEAPAELLGNGHLALTIDPGGDMDRYQGIVPLEGNSLVEAAETYFRQSEQLPTFIRLAVARHYAPSTSMGAREWHWRAGGLLVQHLTGEGGILAQSSHDVDDDDDNDKEHDDDWNRVAVLAATVEDHELLDPELASDRLLFRLFHEEGVTVTPHKDIEANCSCSRERVTAMLSRFGKEDLADMREPDGALTVTCEFCSSKYRFEEGET